MRLDGFSVVVHSDEQRTLPVPCNYPRKSLGVCMRRVNTFVRQSVEFSQLSGAIRPPSNDPFSR
jgi:hypothetical protein